MRPDLMTDDERREWVRSMMIYERRGRAGEPPHWYRTAERVKRFLRLSR